MKIVTLTGPSCSGKTTLLNELVANHGFQAVISHTTRPMRPKEVEGVDYHYVNQEEFNKLLDANQFVESIFFNGYSYGVSVQAVKEVSSNSKVPVLIVEPYGLGQIIEYSKNHDIQVVSVYIDGKLENLFERYLARTVGEDFSNPDTVKRHARRLESLIKEHSTWRGSHNYNMKFHESSVEYMPRIIEKIKEFTND